MVVYIKFYSFYELKNNGSENISDKIDHLNNILACGVCSVLFSGVLKRQ